MATEGELANGLIVGHAYSVTGVKAVSISSHKIRLEKQSKM